MPKLKSNRAAAKRFRPTGSGRFKRAPSHLNHIRLEEPSLEAYDAFVIKRNKS